jgi:hypothetical protein
LQPNIVVKLNWSYDSQYIAVGNAGGQLNVYAFNGTFLIQQGTGVNLTGNVNSVSWHPTNYWIAVGTNTGATNQLYIFSFNQVTGALTQLSAVAIGANVHHVSWHPSGNFVVMGSNNSALRIAVYQVSGAGVLGSNITVNPGATTNGADFNVDGTLLAAVTNNQAAASELYVYAFDPVGFTLTLNTSADLGAQGNSVYWNDITGSSNLLATGGATTTGSLRVYQYNSTPSLTLLAQALNASTVNVARWNQSTGCLGVCLNNTSEGDGAEVRIYTFANNTLTESISSGQVLNVNVFAGGWSPDDNYFASGDSGNLVRVYAFTPTLFSPNYIFSNMRLFLNSDITLKDCQITFTGNNLISGRGNSLSLLTTQTVFSTTISVAANSSLLFQNITIQGIKAGSIVPLDSTATFSFQNCTFVMDSNYTFSLGRFDVIRDFNLEGSNKSFIYTSNQVSRILAEGNMLIDSGVTFSYAPSNNSNTLIQLTDINSVISLNSGTIVTSSAGLQLNKGLLSIDGASLLINGGTNQSQGIIWGDGVSSANNLQLEWQPAATLQLLTGFLVDNNL